LILNIAGTAGLERIKIQLHEKRWMEQFNSQQI
jgi:hypothetical protein